MRTLLVIGLLLAVALTAVFLNSRSRSRAFSRVCFGSKHTHEAIFACDSDSLQIYRDNDLSGVPEKYRFHDGKLVEGTTIPPFKVGDRVYTVTQCYQHIETKPSPRHSLMVHVTIEDDESQFKQYCDVVVSPNADELNRAHFDGSLNVVPLAINWIPIKNSLVIGGEPTDLRVNIGSFDKSAGCWAVIESGANDVYNFPEGVVPVARVEFPSEIPDQPIIRRFELDQFC